MESCIWKWNFQSGHKGTSPVTHCICVLLFGWCLRLGNPFVESTCPSFAWHVWSCLYFESPAIMKKRKKPTLFINFRTKFRLQTKTRNIWICKTFICYLKVVRICLHTSSRAFHKSSVSAFPYRCLLRYRWQMAIVGKKSLLELEHNDKSL